MERVTGIGGVFFRARDPAALAAWYAENLGIAVDASFGGAIFRWSAPGETVWSPFPSDTDYFGTSGQAWMVNYRVRDLDSMLAQLRTAGVAVDDNVEESEFGRFGWASDPEGNRFELWQPPPTTGRY
jgi:predicted enzyme related to lactoylglutathione lyase